MINKILVAIDHSAGSKQVFEKALSIAKADERKFNFTARFIDG